MASETKPTPSEIERAREIAAKYPPAEQRRHVGIQTIVVNVSLALEGAIAQALADARERCAVWHEREAAQLRKELETVRSIWGSAVHADILNRLAGVYEASAAAIRRGEP